jgi:hypothetical protein
MHKTELVNSDILNTSYFSENVDLCNREADSALPSPRSRFFLFIPPFSSCSPSITAGLRSVDGSSNRPQNDVYST